MDTTHIKRESSMTHQDDKDDTVSDTRPDKQGYLLAPIYNKKIATDLRKDAAKIKIILNRQRKARPSRITLIQAMKQQRETYQAALEILADLYGGWRQVTKAYIGLEDPGFDSLDSTRDAILTHSIECYDQSMHLGVESSDLEYWKAITNRISLDMLEVEVEWGKHWCNWVRDAVRRAEKETQHLRTAYDELMMVSEAVANAKTANERHG